MADLEKNLTTSNSFSVTPANKTSGVLELVKETLSSSLTALDSYIEVTKMVDKGNATVKDLEEAEKFAQIIRIAREHGISLSYDLIAYALEEGKGSKFITEVVQEKITNSGTFAGEIRFHGDLVIASCRDGEVELEDQPNLLNSGNGMGLVLSNGKLDKLDKLDNDKPTKLTLVKLIAFDYKFKALDESSAVSESQLESLPPFPQQVVFPQVQPDQPVNQPISQGEPINLAWAVAGLNVKKAA